MNNSLRLAARTKAQAPRENASNHRDRSRSPSRAGAPLRERNVDLLSAEGASLQGLTMNLAHRSKVHKREDTIEAWMSGSKMYRRPLSTNDRPPTPSIAASSIVSDADDITIKTFRAPVTMPAANLFRHRQAAALASRHPTSVRTTGQYLEQRAHIDAITTFWGGCPSTVLSPPLIPKTVRSPTAPPSVKQGPLDPVDWEKDLVKGLRMLAPMCTAKEASLWLMQEMRKDRRDVDTDQDCMTKHTVHAVYKMFIEKGYKARTLTQAQQENKAKRSMLACGYALAAKTYVPSTGTSLPVESFKTSAVSANTSPSLREGKADSSTPNPYASAKPSAAVFAAMSDQGSAAAPCNPYKPSKPSAEMMAATKETGFKFPWEEDDVQWTLSKD